MARNSIRTHSGIATKASRVLRSRSISRAIKKIAASALTNRKRNSRKTSSR